MFDLDAFDKEVSNRFRNPERQGLSFQLKKQKTPIAIGVTGTALALSAFMLANTTILNAAQPVPVTSEMTYNGMTIEEFAVEMGISIYDPYLLVIFEDLCMTEDA